MTNQPVTATVSEPVRAKRPTLYAVLKNSAYGWAIIRLGTVPTTPQDLDINELLITIPGDDAPSGWRAITDFGGVRVDGQYLTINSRGNQVVATFNCGAWWTGTQQIWPTHWMPLPAAPGAKA